MHTSVLKTVLLLIAVVVPLVGGFGPRRVLPLISVVLVPRVGGFGHLNFFQELHVGINEGAFGPASLKRERDPVALPR